MSDKISTKAGIFESGEKDVFGVQYKDGRLIACRNNKLTDYSVADGTEVICDRAFMNLKELRSLELPETIRAVGESAFSGCKSLENINIPEGVTEIRQATFRDTDALTALELPMSVTAVEKFSLGRNLETLTVNSPNVKFDKYAFSNVKDLKTLIVPIGSAEAYRSQLFDIRVKATVVEQELKEETKSEQSIEAANTDNTNQNNMEEEKKSEILRTVVIEYSGNGMRIDVLDSDESVLDCFVGLTEFGNLKVTDGDSISEISIDEIGELFNVRDEEDDEYDEVLDQIAKDLLHPEDKYEDVDHIVRIHSEISGRTEIVLPVDEPLDITKIRLMYTEIILPYSEPSVYCGISYNGKKYPIELDIDTEEVMFDNEIWNCNSDNEYEVEEDDEW